MAMIIKSTEPTELLIGDTWTWSKTFADFPPTLWTLIYFFEKEDASWSVTCTTSAGAFLAVILPAANAAYLPGRFRFFGRVSDGTNSFTVTQGETEVLPNPATPGNRDFRTKAQRTVEALEDLWEKRAGGRRMVTVDGITVTFDSQEDIMRALSRARADVSAEQNADRIRRGLGSLRTIRARM